MLSLFSAILCCFLHECLKAVVSQNNYFIGAVRAILPVQVLKDPLHISGIVFLSDTVSICS